MKRLAVLFALIPYCASAQQQDASKIMLAIRDQRNAALDGLAQCSAAGEDMRARIAELEKQLAASKAAKEESKSQ